MSDPQSGNNVDQIRELLFGPQMREYNKRFEEIQKEIARVSKKLDELGAKLESFMAEVASESEKQNQENLNRLQALEKKIQVRLDELHADLRQKLQQVEENKADRFQFANYLMELAMRLKGENILDQLQEDSESTS